MISSSFQRDSQSVRCVLYWGSVPSGPGCLSAELGNSADGEGELAPPGIWASSTGATAEECSEETLELGTGPVGLIILSNACAKIMWLVFKMAQFIKFILQSNTVGGWGFSGRGNVKFVIELWKINNLLHGRKFRLNFYLHNCLISHEIKRPPLVLLAVATPLWPLALGANVSHLRSTEVPIKNLTCFQLVIYILINRTSLVSPDVFISIHG